MHEENQQLDELPEALVRALKAEEATTLLVPKSVDQAVAEAAHSHFQQLTPRWWTLPATLAACVLVTVVAVQLVRSPDLKGDVDGSGQVDVLDAFALARMQQTNSDIQTADIERLMTRIVSLEEPST
ncbi:MAG: hypothetical protein AAF438_17295 [Pseudomonadota bacterium]